jgi:hypothetical protein
MDKFIAGFLGVLLLWFLAVISGTILFFIWPVAIPAAFPGLVASGFLAAKLPWFTAVCLTWVMAILVKPSTNTTASK